MTVTTVTTDELRELIDQHGLMGSAEAAETIGVPVQNLNVLVGMPEPVAKLRSTRVWLSEEVRAFAREYGQRERVVSARKTTTPSRRRR